MKKLYNVEKAYVLLSLVLGVGLLYVGLKHYANSGEDLLLRSNIGLIILFAITNGLLLVQASKR